VSARADDIDLGAVRRRLEERRDRTSERVAALAQRLELGTAQEFGKRIGDGTVEAISRLTEVGVGSSLEQTLARTKRALAKLDDRTYGSCDACGQPIAPARLHAMPDGVMCLACASSQCRAGSPRRR
jgi:DnaK suppressor protein